MGGAGPKVSLLFPKELFFRFLIVQEAKEIIQHSVSIVFLMSWFLNSLSIRLRNCKTQIVYFRLGGYSFAATL